MLLEEDDELEDEVEIDELEDDEELLDEEVVITWYDNEKMSNKYVDLQTSKDIRERAKPFLKWLHEAEEDTGNLENH